MGLEESLGEEFKALEDNERAVLKTHSGIVYDLMDYIPNGTLQDTALVKGIILRDLATTLKGFSPVNGYASRFYERAQEAEAELIDQASESGAIMDSIPEFIQNPTNPLIQPYVATLLKQFMSSTWEFLRVVTLGAFYQDVMMHKYGIRVDGPAEIRVPVIGNIRA